MANLVDPGGVASPIFPQRLLLSSAGDELDLATLSANLDLQTLVNNVRFDPVSGRYTAEIRMQNPVAANGRQLAAVFSGLPLGVELLNPSGVDSLGSPYINLAPAVPFGGLPVGAVSDAVQFEIDNPSLRRFSINPNILAAKCAC